MKLCSKCKKQRLPSCFKRQSSKCIYCVKNDKQKKNRSKKRQTKVTVTKTDPKRIQLQKEYNAYMRSPEWAAKKDEYWNDPNYPNECYFCGKERHSGMHMHHRTYDRFGAESLDDLVPLCESCHDVITKLWAVERVKPKDKRLHPTLWQATEFVRSEYQS